MRIRSLVILCHERQPLAPGAFAALLARRWQAQGRQIHVHHGLSTPPRADAALLHVDLTRVPPEYLALMDSYPIRLNGRAVDISKRVVSQALVTLEDGYQGPVFVKTDLNSSGRPERHLKGRPTLPQRLWASARRRMPLAWTGDLRTYRRYEHKSEVPAWVWRTPSLVVERFFEERKGDEWLVNQWFMLGQHGCVSVLRAREPVVKLANRQGYLPLFQEVPAEVRTRTRELGLDFAKVDYIVQDGVAHVIDANRTPNQGPEFQTQRVRDVIEMLSDGLDDYEPGKD